MFTKRQLKNSVMIQSSQLLCNHRSSRRAVAILFSINRQQQRYLPSLSSRPFNGKFPLPPLVSVAVGASDTTIMVANAFRGGSSTGRVTHCTYRYLFVRGGICAAETDGVIDFNIAKSTIYIFVCFEWTRSALHASCG